MDFNFFTHQWPDTLAWLVGPAWLCWAARGRRARFFRAAAFLALAWKLATIVRASQPVRQPVSKILTASKSHVVDNNKANTTKIDVTIVLFMNKHISPIDIQKIHYINFNYILFSNFNVLFIYK